MKNIKDTFLLDPNITFLNHGSFGSCPRPIFQEYQKWQKKLEHQPVQFMTDKVYSALKESRIALSEFMGCNEDELVFFPNPTTATTNIIYNLDLNPGDEVVCSSFTFCASANPITYEQAVPVFIDSEVSSWNMCPKSLELALKNNSPKDGI